MTVMTRPAPPRIAGNRVVPFRYNTYSYKPNPVGLPVWRPPVPEPLPPAPLLGLGSLAALGLQALAWWWGQLNSRPPTATGSAVVKGVTGSGTVPPRDNTVLGTFTWSMSAGTFRQFDASCKPLAQDSGAAFGPAELTNVLTARFGTSGQGCGPLAIGFWVKQQGQAQETFRAAFTTGTGIAEFNRSFTSSFSGLNAVPWTEGIQAAPLPDGYVPPGVEPATDPDRLAPPIPLPLPGPGPQPETEPGLVPVQPGPVAPPAVSPALPPSPTRPKPGSVTGTQNGAIVKPAASPAPVTNPEAHFPYPGSGPITGAGARPDIEAVAKEVSRIEQKLAQLLNPAGPIQGGSAADRLDLLLDLLRNLWNSMTDGAPAGEYEISSPCELDDEGDRIVKKVPIPATSDNWERITARVDAVAALLQEHKDLKQPNCPGTQTSSRTGEWVTVKFESDENSDAGERPLRKRLRYLDQTASHPDVHVAHWEHFVWQAGPVIVAHRGAAWGDVQVWAASIGEGKRVIRHAGLVAGVPVDDVGEFLVSGSSDTRYGRSGTMRVEVRRGLLGVSKRPSPSGLPALPRSSADP